MQNDVKYCTEQKASGIINITNSAWKQCKYYEELLNINQRNNQQKNVVSSHFC